MSSCEEAATGCACGHSCEHGPHEQQLDHAPEVAGPPIWPSGIGGAQCDDCGGTTVVRDFGDEEGSDWLCRACAEGYWGYLDDAWDSAAGSVVTRELTP